MSEPKVPSLRRKLRRLGGLALLVGGAEPALAFEGRVQISAAPYTITQPGSYVLTRNLSVNAATTAITVNADYVTIDLNGFAILGPNTCSYSSGAVTCTASGAGAGISATGRQGLRVKSGRIQGVGSLGIFAGAGARVEGIVVRDTGGTGILLGADSVVTRCTVTRVDGAGIELGAAAAGTPGLAIGNAVSATEADGILFQSGVVRGNTLESVGEDGIQVQAAGAVVADNAVYGAWDDDLQGDVGALVIVDNALSGGGRDGSGDNVDIFISAALLVGNALGGAQGSGASSSTGMLAIENSASENVGAGLSGEGCYGRNVLNFNNGGNANPQVSGANLRQSAKNLCGTDATCP